MKKLLILPALALIFMLPGNGCNVLKHKTSDSKIEQVKTQKNIDVSKQTTVKTKDLNSYKSTNSNTTIKETIRYKPTKSENNEAIELTASFKIDTAKTLNGDTALALTGPGVSLTIVRNPKNNSLTATIKKNGSNKKVKVGELRIDRTITNNTSLLDTSKTKVDWKEIKLDSIDKSLKDSLAVTTHDEKIKKSTPNWLFVVGGLLLVGLLAWIFLRR